MTGVKYQTISSSSVNVGGVTYATAGPGVAGGAGYVQADTVHQLKAEQRIDKREYREELHHDLMATMMQQQGTTVISRTTSNNVASRLSYNVRAL